MAVHPLSEDDWQAFEKIWLPYSVKRTTVITAQDDTEKYLYFVVHGIQRICCQDKMGRDATLVFTYNGSFGGVIDSYLLQLPAAYRYEAMSNSIFLRAKHDEFEHLIQTRPQISFFVQKSLTFVISGLLERLSDQQCLSAEERLRVMLSRSPHILNMIPHKYIASYLGINATNFSKLINKVIF